MMSDFILIDGDIVNFLPNFGAAVVVVQPGKIKGSGPATIGKKKICVDGDEKDVSVPNCIYITPQYSIPGTGTLKIDVLAKNQKAKKNKTGGKLLLLKGGAFTAKFEVQNPAKQPTSPPTPDTTLQYSGNGLFITANLKCQGT